MLPSALRPLFSLEKIQLFHDLDGSQLCTLDLQCDLRDALPLFEQQRHLVKFVLGMIFTLLRQLHETDPTGCPIPNHTEAYRRRAEENHRRGYCELDLFPEKDWGFSSPEEAWRVAAENGKYLQNDTLLHGDYCLPNILLNNWRFSGFIDLDSGGVGDRHVDVFWGVWTLFFNLKTNRYYDRFLDAYGREKIEPELLRTVAAFEIFR